MTDDLVSLALRRSLDELDGGPEARIGVAVSGGLDSVVLLHALRHVGPEAPKALHVLHFDHGWRPGSADDAAFVEGLAREAELPFHAESAPHQPVAGPSPEARARALRYAFFRRVAAAEGLDWLLVGHHRDDQRETVAHNLLRGSGPLELAGMPATRELGRGVSTRLARPLLGLDRDTLAAYADRHRLAWREDETNLDARFRRNRIRHGILPALDGPAGLDRLDARGRQLSARADELAERLAATVFGARRGPLPLPPQALALDLDRLRRLPAPLARRVVARGLERLGHAPSPAPAALRRLLDGPAGDEAGIELGVGVAVMTHPDRAGHWLVDRRAPETLDETPLGPDQPVTLADFGLEISVAAVAETPAESRDGAGRWYQDLPAEGGALHVRTARREDRILPFGRVSGDAIALHRYLQDHGVSAARRASFPVVADAEGVLWPIGLAPAGRTRVADGAPARRVRVRIIARP